MTALCPVCARRVQREEAYPVAERELAAAEQELLAAQEALEKAQKALTAAEEQLALVTGDDQVLQAQHEGGAAAEFGGEGGDQE